MTERLPTPEQMGFVLRNGQWVRPKFVLLDIYGFWNDSHESPCRVVGLYDSEAAAVAAAVAHRLAQDEEDRVDDTDPPAKPTTFREDRNAIELVLSLPNGEMAYTIQPVPT